MRPRRLIGKFGRSAAAIFGRKRRNDAIASGRLRSLLGEGFGYLPHPTPASPVASFATPLKNSLLYADPPLTKDALAQAVDRDFEEGRIVMVEGWTLAQTEAQLLALLSSQTK